MKLFTPLFRNTPNTIIDRTTLLQQLVQIIRRHVYGQMPEPLETMGVFHCHRIQKLHSVPLCHPAIILVLNGEKRVYCGAQRLRCRVGEMLLLPGRCELQVENIPAQDEDEYLAMFVPFNPTCISHFLQTDGNQLDWLHQSTQINVVAPEEVLLSFYQRIEWTLARGRDPMLTELRDQELLTLCAQHRLLGSLLRERHPNFVQRVAALISTDCARDWKIADVCQEFAISESSLRRQLQRENSGFRAILEQIRLTKALSLLQETQWNVTEIAGRVGYDSPSRFAARFKKRFGLSPAEVKRSRERLAVSGASLKESGAN